MTRSPTERILTVICSLVLIVFGAAVATGCQYLWPELRVFKLTTGIGHFSFEYPKQYRIQKVELKPAYTDVTFTGPPFVQDVVGTHGSVFVQSYRGSEVNVEAIVDTDIENWQTPNTFPDLDNFVLISRSPIVVAGIKGEQVKYSSDSLLTRSDIDRGLKPVTIISREVYLAHDDSLWTSTWAYQKTTEASDQVFEDDFDRILKSFKILD